MEGGWVAIRTLDGKKYLYLDEDSGILSLRDSGIDPYGRLQDGHLFQLHNHVPCIGSTTIRCRRENKGGGGATVLVVDRTKKSHLLCIRVAKSESLSPNNMFQVVLAPNSFIAFRNPFTDTVLRLGVASNYHRRVGYDNTGYTNKVDEQSVNDTPREDQTGSGVSVISTATHRFPKMDRHPSGLVHTFKVMEWKCEKSTERSFLPLPVMSFVRRWMPRQGVIAASYGAAVSSSSSISTRISGRVDVTSHVRSMVSSENGHLIIPANTECSQLFGMDPAKGKAKTLIVEFRRGLTMSRWTHPSKIHRRKEIFVGKHASPSPMLVAANSMGNSTHQTWRVEPVIIKGIAGFLIRSATTGGALRIGIDGNDGKDNVKPAVYVSSSQQAFDSNCLFQPIAAYPSSRNAVNDSDIQAATNLLPLPAPRKNSRMYISASNPNLTANVEEKKHVRDRNDSAATAVAKSLPNVLESTVISTSSSRSFHNLTYESGLHRKLEIFYRKYKPSKVVSAALIAERYSGREVELNAQLMRAYGSDLNSLFDLPKSPARTDA